MLTSEADTLRSAVKSLSPAKQAALQARLHWLSLARPEQIPPRHEDWFAYLALAGRGWGKTRVCAEDCWFYAAWNDEVRVGVVAPTNADLKRTVFEGESGLRAVVPPAVLLGGSFDGSYNSTDKELYFANGSLIQGFSSESYERLRGPQFHRGWAEELAAWPYPQETWDMLMFGLRLGQNPRVVISTTPKPKPLVKQLAAAPDTFLVQGSTYDNKDNLAPTFLRQIEKQYAGTRISQQELYGKILEDVEGSLWNWQMIQRARWYGALPQFTYVVIAVDPSVGELTKRGKERSREQDECGIVVCALGKDGLGYVLLDRSMTGTPDQWAKVVVETYADRSIGVNWVVAEKNQGGAMVTSVLKAADPNIPVRLVSASQAKRTRAEPVSMLYEQCVAQGTLIATDRGCVPIEAVTLQDRVWTRDGLKRVLWSGQTGVKETLQVEADNGMILQCTHDHPILTSNNEFVCAGQLVPKADKIVTWSSTNRDHASTARNPYQNKEYAANHVRRLIDGLRPVNLSGLSRLLTEYATIGKPTDTIGPDGTVAINCFTGRYGPKLTVPSLPIGMYTISTATQVTTELRIWLRSLLKSIEHVIQGNLYPKMSSHACQRSEGNGGEIDSQRITSANSAVLRLSRLARWSDSVRRPVTRNTGLGVIGKCAKMPVYNLMIEEQPEFFANGILVHNCRIRHCGIFPDLEMQMTQWSPTESDLSPDRMDALVWGFTKLMVESAPGFFCGIA